MSLKRNKEITSKLIPAYGDLGKLIERAEDLFRLAKFPAPACAGDLGWRMCNGKWRIMYIPGEVPVPLAEVPLAARVKLILLIPDLYEALIKQKEIFLPVVLEQLDKVKNFLDSIDSKAQ